MLHQRLLVKTVIFCYRAYFLRFQSENDIRKDILDILYNNKEFELQSYTCNDFEFIDVNGKVANVLTCKTGQEINGRCLKQIAGLGSVYIRLTKPLPNRNICVSDDSDFEPSAKSLLTMSDSNSDDELQVIHLPESPSLKLVDLPDDIPPLPPPLLPCTSEVSSSSPITSTQPTTSIQLLLIFSSCQYNFLIYL